MYSYNALSMKRKTKTRNKCDKQHRKQNGKKLNSEDKGMKEILGLGDCGQKITLTKKYLNIIWKNEEIEQ